MPEKKWPYFGKNWSTSGKKAISGIPEHHPTTQNVKRMWVSSFFILNLFDTRPLVGPKAKGGPQAAVLEKKQESCPLWTGPPSSEVWQQVEYLVG